MRVLILVTLISLLNACYALNNPSGTVQPVQYKNVKDGILFTTCSGTVEDSSSCNKKARNSCPNGYDVIEWVESPVGGKRELTFKCK